MEFYLLFVVSQTIIALVDAGVKNDITGTRQGNDDDSKIIVAGGDYTPIERVPYQVFLKIRKIDNFYFSCGGSIISPTSILTAAHCLIGATLVEVRAGSSDSQEGGTTYSTSTRTSHPQFNPVTFDNDVAIVNLTFPLFLDGITTKVVPLAPEETELPAGSFVLISGWGAFYNHEATSRYLMSAVVETVPDDYCRKVYVELNGFNVNSKMICIGVPEGGKNPCQGDSGGPIVNLVNGVQVGIVSNGVGCGEPGIPSVSTKVASVRAWIKSVAGV